MKPAPAPDCSLAPQPKSIAASTGPPVSSKLKMRDPQGQRSITKYVWISSEKCLMIMFTPPVVYLVLIPVYSVLD